MDDLLYSREADNSDSVRNAKEGGGHDAFIISSAPGVRFNKALNSALCRNSTADTGD